MNDDSARKTRSIKWRLITYYTSLALLWISSFLILGQLAGGLLWLPILAASATFPLLLKKATRRTTHALFLTALWLLTAAIYFSHTPRNDRQWVEESSRLPKIEIQGDLIQVKDLRDFTWSNAKTYTPNWTSHTYNLNHLETLEVIVEPFGDSKYTAHVFMRFAFSNGESLAISVEARRETHESYGLIAGAARQFELIYVFATENDIFDLRTTHRDSHVCAYPIRATQAFKRNLLLELCQSANDLHTHPKFYATLRHNCTTTLLKHANRTADQGIASLYQVLFPAKVGELIHRLELMDTELSYPEAHQHFQIHGPR